MTTISNERELNDLLSSTSETKQIEHTTFETRLWHTDLSGYTFDDCSFQRGWFNVSARDCTFRDSSLPSMQFCDLRGSKFPGSGIIRRRWDCVKVDGCNFKGCKFGGSEFRRVSMDYRTTYLLTGDITLSSIAELDYLWEQHLLTEKKNEIERQRQQQVDDYQDLLRSLPRISSNLAYIIGFCGNETERQVMAVLAGLGLLTGSNGSNDRDILATAQNLLQCYTNKYGSLELLEVTV